jgi:hypothetical protein
MKSHAGVHFFPTQHVSATVAFAFCTQRLANRAMRASDREAVRDRDDYAMVIFIFMHGEHTIIKTCYALCTRFVTLISLLQIDVLLCPCLR